MAFAYIIMAHFKNPLGLTTLEEILEMIPHEKLILFQEDTHVSHAICTYLPDLICRMLSAVISGRT